MKGTIAGALFIFSSIYIIYEGLIEPFMFAGHAFIMKDDGLQIIIGLSAMLLANHIGDLSDRE